MHCVTRLPFLMIFAVIQTTPATYLQIHNLHENPILLMKTKYCKIQTGVSKIIHPINLTSIQDSIESLVSIGYNSLAKDNPLGNIIWYKTKKLYSSFHQIKPQHHHRERRWDTLGSAWKWIAGSPDADDLRIINSTLTNLIDENNRQYQVNENINHRLTQLTEAINNVIDRVNSDTTITKEIEAITIIMNIDIIEKTIEDIQDAIIWSKSSLIANRILSIQDINVIKSSLRDQGVNTELPEEALRLVTPKFAVNGDILLYILHIPQFSSKNATIMRLYPLPQKNQIIHDYPDFLIQDEETLFETTKPEETIQKASYLKEFDDHCIKSIIYGKQTHCTSSFNNRTSQSFILSNTILITNARNNTLGSDCGPDNRTLSGNLLIHFKNCTVTFNALQFHGSEITEEIQIIRSAFHNSMDIQWKPIAKHDIAKINDIVINNRHKLEHVYLRQNHLNLKLWTSFAGFSSASIICFIILVCLFKNIQLCSKLKCIRPESAQTDPRRLELKEGGVTTGQQTATTCIPTTTDPELDTTRMGTLITTFVPAPRMQRQ